MLVAILAVHKAGAAYVPVDADYPLDRMQYVLSDTQTKLLITERELANNSSQIMPDSCSLICMDERSYEAENHWNLPIYARPHDLAYVIYTSGTTGKPKGVMVSHDSLMNLVTSYKNKLNRLCDFEKIAQIFSFSFDGSCLNYALSWTYGYELHILSKLICHDSHLIAQYIHSHAITYVDMPTMLYQVLTEKDLAYLGGLKYLMIGGQQLGKGLNNRGLGYFLVNAYGPTECTGWSSLAIYSNDTHHQDINPSSIGKALDNTQLYVLDERQEVVPVGVAGELYIGGAGLARGYLNQDELTAERFILNPFATKANQNKGLTHIYKTGDLVRWLSDGSLEYIGRRDFQVKIRGYRIELAEIEKCLLSYPTISQSVVSIFRRKALSNQHDHLLAYYISPEKIKDSVLIKHLSASLPHYMIPNLFIHMHSFPSTINGKTDRSALPEPEFQSNPSVYIEPKTKMERIICNIWQMTLGVEKISMSDDFFQLGGDSIQLIQMAGLLRQEGLDCRVGDISAHRTINKLARFLRRHHLNTEPQHVLTSTKWITRTLYHQLKQRYDIQAIFPAFNFQPYFAQFAMTDKFENNKFSLLRILDYHVKLDIEYFKKAWQLVIEKFPALRTCFNWDQQLIQIICKSGRLNFTEYDISSEYNKDCSEAEIIKQINTIPFDLQKPSLFSLHLIKHSEEYYVLFLRQHHIILDGWGGKNMVRVANEIYLQLLENNIPEMKEDVAYIEAQYYIFNHQSIAETFWEKQLKSFKCGTGLNDFFDHPVDDVINSCFDIHEVNESRLVLDGEMYKRHLNIVKQEGITLHVLVQYACHSLLKKYTNEQQTMISMTTSGRSLPILGIDNSVGCYINSLPIIFDWDHHVDMRGNLHRLHHSLMMAEQHDFVTTASFYQHAHVEVIFNNFPQTLEDTKNSGRLHVSERFVEKPIMTNLIVITCTSADNALYIDFAFNRSFLSFDRAGRILEQLKLIFCQMSDTLL